jgi:hypothetical protein
VMARSSVRREAFMFGRSILRCGERWAVGNGIPVDDCDKYRALARAPLMRMLELSFSMLPFILAK